MVTWDEFEKARAQAIPDQWTRYRWLEQREAEILGGRRLGIERGARGFYRSAAYAYFTGSPPGAILLATTACERLLRIITSSDENIFLAPLIDKAEQTHRVSSSMATQLRRVNRLIRVPIAHGKTAAMLGALGMEKVDPFTWRVPKGQKRLTTVEAAQEALETFLRLLADLYDKEAKPTSGP
ncbi:MAG TPA: hypothetical protein VGA48_00980 [Thermoplasmata archaeon]